LKELVPFLIDKSDWRVTKPPPTALRARVLNYALDA